MTKSPTKSQFGKSMASNFGSSRMNLPFNASQLPPPPQLPFQFSGHPAASSSMAKRQNGDAQNVHGMKFASSQMGRFGTSGAGLATSRMGGFNTSRMGGFNTSRMEGFNTSRMGGFNTSRMEGFGASKMGRFDNSKIGGFNTSRLGGFDISRNGGFTTSGASFPTSGLYTNLLPASNFQRDNEYSPDPTLYGCSSLLSEYELTKMGVDTDETEGDADSELGVDVDPSEMEAADSKLPESS